MIKADIVDLVVDLAKIPRAKAATAVETVIESMRSALGAGDRIELRGFGVFQVKRRKRGIGRNPEDRRRGHDPSGQHDPLQAGQGSARPGITVAPRCRARRASAMRPRPPACRARSARGATRLPGDCARDRDRILAGRGAAPSLRSRGARLGFRRRRSLRDRRREISATSGPRHPRDSARRDRGPAATSESAAVVR